MPNQSVTSFTTVDHTTGPDFFLHFLDEANKLPDAMAWMMLDGARADGYQ
jgi:hypothetical protein